MKNEKQAIDKFFVNAKKRESMLRDLDKLIQKNAPKLDRKLVDGMTNTTMLGYGFMPYTFANGKEGEWPLIGLANQKNYVSLYMCAVKDGEYLAEKHREKLGKVSIGRSCIRFNKLEKINPEELAIMVREAAELYDDDSNEFGKKKI